MKLSVRILRKKIIVFKLCIKYEKGTIKELFKKIDNSQIKSIKQRKNNIKYYGDKIVELEDDIKTLKQGTVYK